MEPNLDDLFRPKHFTRQQIIVMILLLCAFGVWLLWPTPHPHPAPKPAPAPQPAKKQPAASPLYVTVVPDESGWCCAAGKVSAATRANCEGTFFAQEEKAKRSCLAPPTAPSGSPKGRGRGA